MSDENMSFTEILAHHRKIHDNSTECLICSYLLMTGAKIDDIALCQRTEDNTLKLWVERKPQFVGFPTQETTTAIAIEAERKRILTALQNTFGYCSIEGWDKVEKIVRGEK